MKVIIFSDSHEDVHTMELVVNKIHPDYIIHLGDHIDDAELLQKWFSDIPFEMVKGNCDKESLAESSKVIQIGEIKILITHGDQYDNLNNSESLIYKININEMITDSLKCEVRAVLYGHTHTAALTYERGVVAMNPGSIRRRLGSNTHASFGIIEINGADFSCNIVSTGALIE